jgi:hypothetical protein
MELLREFLFWLDVAPWRYWTLATVVFALTCLMAGSPGRAPGGRWWTHSGWFVLAVIATLAAFRWPTWFVRYDINPDEAQIVAGALTLDRFPVMWKYLDSTTHGPLSEYALIVVGWLGAPFNYVTARLVALLMHAGALLAAWRTLRLFTTETVARLGILPGLAFWSFVSWEDFVHYASLLPSVLLLALAGWGIASALGPSSGARPPGRALFATGLALGAVPFAKLQAVPQGLAMALIALGLLAWRNRRDRPKGYRQAGLLISGGLSVPFVVGVFLGIFGLTHQFGQTYLRSAVAFLDTSTYTFEDMPGVFFNIIAVSPAFAWFFVGGLAFALLWWRLPDHHSTLRSGVLLAAGLVGVAYFCVLRPGRETPHYLHLLVIPLTLLIGFTLARGQAALAMPRDYRSLAFSFVLLTLLPQVYDRAVTWNPYAGRAREHWAAPLSPAAQFLRQHARPVDTLAMWGWQPHLLVETQLPHGTREALSANQIMQWAMTDFFVDRYLHDLRRRQPAWFVDVVGPGAFIFDDRLQHAHETIPALRELIAHDYELTAEFDHVRVYRRRPGGV